MSPLSYVTPPARRPGVSAPAVDAKEEKNFSNNLNVVCKKELLFPPVSSAPNMASVRSVEHSVENLNEIPTSRFHSSSVASTVSGVADALANLTLSSRPQSNSMS